MSNDKSPSEPIVWGATLLWALSAAVVAADPAKTTWTTYLYQGPGYRYAVIDEVPQTSTIQVGACADDWCEVTFGDRVGYLRANVVARGDLTRPGQGVLAQPGAGVRPVPPAGPCFDANQTGGNGGNAMTVFCRN